MHTYMLSKREPGSSGCPTRAEADSLGGEPPPCKREVPEFLDLGLSAAADSSRLSWAQTPNSPASLEAR